MPALPIAARLKRRLHREVAEAQDLVVMGAFDAFPAAVLHGGTAIWRCYGGNRFSEDVDFYLPASARGHADRLGDELRRRMLQEQKLEETSGSVFARFGAGATAVRFEATFRTVVDVVVRRYEMVDGSFAAVRTLDVDALVREKAGAYEGRRKARDLYDVFSLIRLTDGDPRSRSAVRSMLGRFSPPVDERSLRSIIITGSVPTVADMREEIERWGR